MTTSIGAHEGSLTRRALLTLVSSLLEQGAQSFLAFFLTPVIISVLGAELYGAWSIIQQTIGYVAIADLRPMATLKFTLGRRQHEDDPPYNQRQIGAALIMWVATVPLILGVGSVFVVLSPHFITTASTYVSAVQIALALAVLDIALDRLLSLPSNVLRGLNLDYKAMGLNAFVILLGGLLSAIAVWIGLGLPGLASAGFLGAILQSCVRLVVTRRLLTWFRPARPSRAELLEFVRLSAWLFVSAFSTLLLLSSDLLVIGFMFGPAVVTIYATTGAVLRLSSGFLTNGFSAGGPGIIGLIGQNAWNRVEQVRSEMYIMTLTIMTIIGGGTIALNQAFLRLWVGENLYGGMTLTVMLVLSTLVVLLYRIDGTIIDGMLLLRTRTISMAVAALFSVTTGIALSSIMGLSGIVVGLLLGRISLLVYSWWLISQQTGIDPTYKLRSLMRPLLVGTLTLTAATQLAPFMRPTNWFQFILAGAAIAASLLAIVWFVGLGAQGHAIVSRRVIGQVPSALVKRLIT